MDTVLFLLHIRGLKPLLVVYFHVEEKFAGGKFRGRKISRNSIRSGYYFRGRKISRKIKIRENSQNLLQAKYWCYTLLSLDMHAETIGVGPIKPCKTCFLRMMPGKEKGSAPECNTLTTSRSGQGHPWKQT